MKPEEKLEHLVKFLKMIADDPDIRGNYRAQAALLVPQLTDPTENPFAPPIQLTVTDNKVVGHANFGSTFEGFSGTVHGGFVAAAFDQVLYMAESITGLPAMTATLTVRYRSPTPLLTELTLIGEVDRIEGRKIFTRATVSANGVVTAEAEGLFIALDQG